MPKAKTAIQKAKANLPANIDLIEDAGGGFETADKDAYAIPFLTILQKLSPQCDKEYPEFIKGAKAGMIFNTVTEELYDGKKGIVVVPAFYQRIFIEWILRSAGGGFVRQHEPDPRLLEACTIDDSQGLKFIMDNGHELKDHRNHFVVFAKTMIPALISMTSSQIKRSKKWMSQMQALKVEIKKQIITPPMFYSRFHLTTVIETKDTNKWYGWKIERTAEATTPEYVAARDFKAAIETGVAKADFSKAADIDAEADEAAY